MGQLFVFVTAFVCILLHLKCNFVCVSVYSSCVNLHNQQHILVMCAAAFYLIENYPLDVGPDFTAGIIQVSVYAIRTAMLGNRDTKLRVAAIFHGSIWQKMSCVL